jgi:hypothetical protein
MMLKLFEGHVLGFRAQVRNYKKLQNHHRLKKTNGSAPEEVAIRGKVPKISAFIIQCAEFPKLCPFARTGLGNNQ